MYKQSMANGAAASAFFLLFLYFLARHMRNIKSNEYKQSHGGDFEPNFHCSRPPPPPYSISPQCAQPPPSYQEVVKIDETSDDAKF